MQSCTKQLNFVFIDYPLLIKYLVIFRWHQITKTLLQIRYLKVLTPHILRPPLPCYLYIETCSDPPPDIKTSNY